MEVSVCVGSSCHLKGSYPVIEEIKRLSEKENVADKIELKAAFCSGNCVNGVCIQLDGRKVVGISPKNIEEVFYNQILPALE